MIRVISLVSRAAARKLPRIFIIRNVLILFFTQNAWRQVMYSSDMGYIQMFQPLKETSPEVLLLDYVHLF